MDTQAPSDTVTIPREEYARLRESERWLSALEDAGVDNWDGISYAQDIMQEMDNE